MDKMRILLIDDSRADCANLSRTLARFEIDHAVSIESGLELLKAERYDLLLIDVRMPSTDKAYAVLPKQIFNELPVIVITGGENDTELINDIIDYGAVGFLNKKISNDAELLESFINAGLNRFERRKRFQADIDDLELTKKSFNNYEKNRGVG